MTLNFEPPKPEQGIPNPITFFTKALNFRTQCALGSPLENQAFTFLNTIPQLLHPLAEDVVFNLATTNLDRFSPEGGVQMSLTIESASASTAERVAHGLSIFAKLGLDRCATFTQLQDQLSSVPAVSPDKFKGLGCTKIIWPQKHMAPGSMLIKTNHAQLNINFGEFSPFSHSICGVILRDYYELALPLLAKVALTSDLIRALELQDRLPQSFYKQLLLELKKSSVPPTQLHLFRGFKNIAVINQFLNESSEHAVWADQDPQNKQYVDSGSLARYGLFTRYLKAKNVSAQLEALFSQRNRGHCKSEDPPKDSSSPKAKPIKGLNTNGKFGLCRPSHEKSKSRPASLPILDRELKIGGDPTFAHWLYSLKPEVRDQVTQKLEKIEHGETEGVELEKAGFYDIGKIKVSEDGPVLLFAKEDQTWHLLLGCKPTQIHKGIGLAKALYSRHLVESGLGQRG